MSTEPMGKILTTLTITNRIDQANAKQGLIPAEAVRSVTIEQVLVDTGATTLCLPADAIAQLGERGLGSRGSKSANQDSSATVWRQRIASNMPRALFKVS
jgi:predicted aspartyl protease